MTFHIVIASDYLLGSESWQMQRFAAVSAHDGWQKQLHSACTCALASGSAAKRSVVQHTANENHFAELKASLLILKVICKGISQNL